MSSFSRLILPGQPVFPQLPLHTKQGRQIPNKVRHEPPPARLRASVELWQRERPGAVLRSLTGTYNCIGMIVACRRTCVEPEDLLWVLADDGCRKLGGEAEAQLGDVVVYRNDVDEVAHAGIVIEKRLVDPANPREAIRVLSKWGDDGEYEHDAPHVPPRFGKPAEYWTDRKVIA
ncbi:MAG: hypothetical protein K2W96_16395 [Gemmataceae bacterium]|nr:hypothetical protein [Gemmataceae bacterium]